MRDLLRMGIVCWGIVAAEIRCDATTLASPPDAQELLAIDGVRVDGSLGLSYPVDNVNLGSGQSLNFNLVHLLEVGSDKRVFSRLVVPELQSYLVPLGQRVLKWKVFGGGEYRFVAPDLSEKFHLVGPGLQFRRPNADTVFIHSPEGWLYEFSRGLPVRATGPSLLKYVFRTQGGWITSVEISRMGGTLCSVSARYDSQGRLELLRLPSATHYFRYEGGDGALSTWIAERNQGSETLNFKYDDGLLSSIIKDGRPLDSFRWAAVPGWMRSDSKWTYGMRIEEARGNRYSYELRTSGFSLVAESRVGKGRREVIFNSRKGTIERLRDGAIELRAWLGLHRDRPGYGMVTRMTDFVQNETKDYF